MSVSLCAFKNGTCLVPSLPRSPPTCDQAQEMSSMQFTRETVEAVGSVLNETSRPLAERFRALFTLRGIGTDDAVVQIARCLQDTSALLKHECAYCLGQIQNPTAVNVLKSVLADSSQEAMVRHEAGEALGAIGHASLADFLQQYVNEPVVEVAETCQIAVDRIKWYQRKEAKGFEDTNPYLSVDPAPPFTDGSVNEWRETLNDTSASMFDRYRAMFALRNCGNRDAVNALTDAFTERSALFRHELAYILGQLQDRSTVRALLDRLQDKSENPMVRHECAEALGSIATEECMQVLRDYAGDEERVVRESCEVALDMLAYEQSGVFQYADTVSKVNSTC